MASCPARRVLRRRLVILLCTSATAALLAGGCAKDKYRQARPAPYGKTAAAAPQPISALQAATAHWAAAYNKNPKDPKAALNYALNLKALGAQGKAMEVLAAAHDHNPTDPAIASEYGRLALAADQISLATRLLNVAEKGTAKPDWKLLSALGTLHAKKGEPEAAQRYYLAALQQKPDSLSTMNNLALSYALDGKADKAETMLRTLIAKGGDNQRVRQNLALVVGLQGKFSEGQQIAQADLPATQADANMDYLRNMVGRQPTEIANADNDARTPEPVAPKANKVPPAPALRELASSAPRPAKPAVNAVASHAKPAPAATAAIGKADTTASAAKLRSPLEAWAAAPTNVTTTTVAAASPQSFEPLPWQTSSKERPSAKDNAPDAAGWGASVRREPVRLAPASAGR